MKFSDTQLNSNSEDENVIESGDLGSSSSTVASFVDSVLNGKFDLTFSGYIWRSNLSGVTSIIGGGNIIDSKSTGTLRMNTNGGNSGPNFIFAVNEGSLNMTNSVQASNATFRGINTYFVPGTFNSTIQSFINNADVEDTNLSGYYNVTSDSRRSIKNLQISNSHPIGLSFGINTWQGKLTLNGSMVISSNNIGNNVTINAIAPANPTSFHLALGSSTIGDGLFISETGTYIGCSFSGSGSSYTNSCNPVNSLIKRNTPVNKKLASFDTSSLKLIEKERVNKRIAELKALYEYKNK